MRNLVLFWALTIGSLSQGASIDWSGTYRFEWHEINKPSLDGGDTDGKGYGLHYLTVRPKILASDGISILSRLDFLANKSPEYANSQLGQTWGGSDYGKATPGSSGVNNTTRSQQINTNVKIRELYLQVEEEYGALLVGRAPYEFGLGMTHDAGLDPFDHWYDNRDMIAYKFFVGDLSFMPMLSRSYDRGPESGHMNQEQSLEINYDNKDAGAQIALLFERKNASRSVVESNINTPWATALNQGTAPTVTGGFSYERTSFLLGRNWDTFGFKLETAFEKGKTGYSNVSRDEIQLSGFGLAAEIEFKPASSKWDYQIWLGTASGDNPGTVKFEGYQFDRNYDVAMLLFNHRLGRADFLKTDVIKNNLLNTENTYDDEAISNASYLSLRTGYHMSDKWSWKSALTYAQLMDKMSSTSDMKKDLGLELDIGLTYKPREKVWWVNEIGVLLPGEAWKNGSSNWENGSPIGFSSKAAISF